LYKPPWLPNFGSQGFKLYFMKKLVLAFCLITNLILAQDGFGEQNLINIDQSSTVIVADLNQDNRLDVIISDFNDSTIAWYKCLNNNNVNFSEKIIISDNLPYTRSVVVGDINGDNDLDIIASSSTYNRVVWYENLDGQGTFSYANIIGNNVMDAWEVKVADLDGDGDLDVIATNRGNNTLSWFKNLDGQGTFSPELIINNNAISVYAIQTADVDGDGDIDVLANSSSFGYPAWYENLDGQGTFATENIIVNRGVFNVIPADIDGDNDIDLFLKTIENDVTTIFWYENIDGLGTFTQRQLITNDSHPREFYPSDVDNDGDIDLLVVFVGDGGVTWFENTDGLGLFSEKKVIDTVVGISIVPGKIDQDEYFDVIASTNDGIVWYKNENFLGVNDVSTSEIILAPNPTSGVVTLQGQDLLIKSITVYDVLGQLVLTQNNNKKNVDLSLLSSGIYLIKIETEQGVEVKKIVKE